MASRVADEWVIGRAYAKARPRRLRRNREFPGRRLTAQPHAQVRFRRAIERRALWLGEDAARELPTLSLQEALQLVHLYAERGSPNS